MIYACFEGMGKRELAMQEDDVVYINIGHYKWENSFDDAGVHPDFPQNFIEQVRQCNQKGLTVLVDTYNIVLEVLKDANLEYIIYTPTKDLKEEYLNRYRELHYDPAYIKYVDSSFDKFVDTLMSDKGANVVIPISESNTYLKDIFAYDHKQR